MANKIVYRFCLVTTIATWILLIIGGLVNPMGASMACPDWYFIPTCNNEFFPLLVSGVLYEHGHRLVASMVGILTFFLAFLCLRSPSVDKTSKVMGVGALILVIVQGVLGGVTVLLNLSAIVSTLHLLCAMLFFSLLICLSFRLAPGAKPVANFKNFQTPMFLAILLTMFQLILGGVVRHMGAGLACGNDLLTCGSTLWPEWSLGQLHMIHRFLGYALFFMVIYASLKARAQAKFIDKNHFHARLALLPIAITLTQIFLGLMSIYTLRNPAILAMHTGFGALLLASLLSVYILQLPKAEAKIAHC